MAPDSTPERIGVAWLHVISEHPVYGPQYDDLMRNRTPSLEGRTRRMTGRLLQSMRALDEGRRRFWGDPPKRADILFVSHFLNESHASSPTDFYFGDMPLSLSARGRSCIIAQINHSERSPRSFMAAWRTGAVPRVLLSRSLGLRGDFDIYRRLGREARRLRTKAKSAGEDFQRRVLLHASSNAGSMVSVTSLRIGEQIADLVLRVRPKALVLTHEGYAYERIAFAAARKTLPGIRCIGYHHTISLRRQHALKRSLRPEYNPDAILTAGYVTRDQFARAPGLAGIPVAVLGTHRRAPAVREQRSVDRPACVVIPEGQPGESAVLFGFALECAARAPGVQFLLRLHPALPFEAIAKVDPRLRSLPANVSFSANSIADDFSRCWWALYRGSSASVHAVLAGLRPVYVSKPGEMPIDPLYQLDCWRASVEMPDAFLRHVDADLKVGREALAAEAQPAIEYCNQYFTPVDIAALESAIDSR
jgi:hypothetical protein